MTDNDRASIPPPLGRRAVALAVVVLIAAVSMPALGAAQPTSELPADSAVVVALQDDGSARLTLVIPFDLTTTNERVAFEELRANATAREQRAARFASRMRAIADRAETEVDREMQIDQPTVAFAERGDTGIVALSVRWVGLAARTDDELVLQEPFASGVTFDRPFHVVAPEGYRLTSVNPAPSQRSEARAIWSAETSLDGFEARFEPAGPQSLVEIVAEAPGFGIGVAITALLLGAGLLFLRNQHRS